MSVITFGTIEIRHILPALPNSFANRRFEFCILLERQDSWIQGKLFGVGLRCADVMSVLQIERRIRSEPLTVIASDQRFQHWLE